MKPGFNAMIVGDDWKADTAAAMRRVAAMGFAGAELGMPDSPEKLGQVRAALAASGLAPVTGHVLFGPLLEDFAGTVRAAHALGLADLTISWSPFDSLEYIGQAVAWCNGLGRRLRAEGIRLHYHNHAHECALFDGRVGLELLYERTDPDCLWAHLDTHWLARGGQDPAAWVRRMAGRCGLLHLKDMDVQGGFCELGGGVLDLAGICREAEASGVEWVIYEQDAPGRLGRWESAAASAREMKRLGLI